MINVIGLGYIGLPTALTFARSGFKVIGTDTNKNLIDSLSKGKLPFEEDGLEELFSKALSNGIKFTTEYQKSNIYIISVPTPYIKESNKPDQQYLISAINRILDVCEKGSILIIESTISPGTTDKYIRPIIESRGFLIKRDIHLVHAPERIIPGNMLYELQYNSRTIGVDDSYIGKRVKELYSSFCKGKIVITDIKSAEMSKVVENTYRDINIAFANELAKICRSDDMDVYEIIKLANEHPRVNILQPSPGVGGHCISVDPWFLVYRYPTLSDLILTARTINNSMPKYVLERIREIMKEHDIKDMSKVGLYGLSYKENVNDIRESPTLQLLKIMNNDLDYGVKIFDPYINTKIVDNQIMNFEDFINKIDLLVIMLAHNHIINNLDSIRGKVILDTRNICNFNGVYKL